MDGRLVSNPRYGWTPRFEPVDNNPYLADFYADMPRWSFNLQVYFLNKRFKEVVEISKSSDTIIQDRTIFEDARIFAPNLHGQGMMSDRDFANYTDLFDLMMSLVKLPDLMIYIRSSIPTLVAQIQKRGREYEQTMRLDYLEGLSKRYEDWISTYKGQLIIIEGDTCKFGERAEDFKQVTDMIDAKLRRRLRLFVLLVRRRDALRRLETFFFVTSGGAVLFQVTCSSAV